MRSAKLILAGIGSLAALKLVGDAAIERHEQIDLELIDTPGERIEVGGLNFHYLDVGSGPAVVLVHGLGASTFSFRRNIEALAERFRVIAVDLPGFGYSTRSAPDMSMTGQVQYLASFLEAVGISRASLVGHSMGGLIVQRFAVTYPGRVENLVLMNSATQEVMRRAAWSSATLAPFLPLVFAVMSSARSIRRWWLSFAVYDGAFVTGEVMRGYGAPGQVRGHVRATQRWFVDRGKDVPFDPRAISAPTLIVWGEADRVLRPILGYRLQRQIPNAQLLVIPKAGHWTPEEQPETVNQALLDFLAEGRESGAAVSGGTRMKGEATASGQEASS